jgi:Type II secretion system protein C
MVVCPSPTTCFKSIIRFPAIGARKSMILAFRDRLWSVAPSLVFFAAAAAIIALSSLWFWSAVQPARQAVGIGQTAEPGRLAIELQARHLFGAGGTDRAGQVGHSGNLRLVGAVAGEGIALIAIDGRSAQSFRTGMEVVPGVRLTSVLARRVELERRGGEKEVLQMPEAGLPAASHSK